MRKSINYGPANNMAKLWVALLLCLTTPLVAHAETAVTGKVINAPVKIENSANIAAGSDNKAQHSSVALKNARVSGTVANSVQNRAAVNVAAGKNNSANHGSVSVSRATVKGIISNSASTKATTNLAVGNDNQANQASVTVKGSTVTGSVSNISMGRNMLNAAVGSGNQVNQSSTIIKNSSLSGKLSNAASGNSQINIAVGRENKADQGSVRVESSRIRGTVSNTSSLQKSANVAVGDANSASQAAIVMGGTQVNGLVVNQAAGDNAVNAAIGTGNEANQSSIVVDGDQTGRGSAVTMSHSSQEADAGGLVNLLPITEAEQKEATRPTSAGTTKGQEEKGQGPARHVPGQVVFLVDNDQAGLASLDRVARKYKLNVGETKVLKSLNRIMVVSSTARDAAEIAEALNGESGVYSSQPNYIFKTMGDIDPLSGMQNLVSMLDLPQVHTRVSGKNVTVAVVDTGVEVDHQDLRSRMAGYQNFVSGSDYRGEIHGTAVAGIIGAESNEYGIVGVAPDVSLVALRACRQVSDTAATGECFSTSLALSLDAAISAKVDVANLSLGAQVDDNLLSMVIERGYEAGILFTAPVGNDPTAEKIAFPASHDKVISIAGLDENGRPLPNVQLASLADAVAPATNLFVTTTGNSYNFSDGTSLASASISGIIALGIEKKNARGSPCLPRYSSTVPWARQVFSCLDM